MKPLTIGDRALLHCLFSNLKNQGTAFEAQYLKLTEFCSAQPIKESNQFIFFSSPSLTIIPSTKANKAKPDQDDQR